MIQKPYEKGFCMNIRIIVATHKEYPFPKDPMYLPVQAGAEIHPALPYTGDNTGENISEKNRNYCELTCLYWAWKNLDADYLGLCHYRRYFSGKNFGSKWNRILSMEQAIKLLGHIPVLLPKKRIYFIETGYSQYAHSLHEEDLVSTRAVLTKKYPQFVPTFDATLKRTTGHRFNMFIMRRDLLDQYCSWLFDVLFELERRLDISSYSEYEKRVFGFVAERLLDVWIETNHVPYWELPVLHMESQHWLKKGTTFLKRKFLRR